MGSPALPFIDQGGSRGYRWEKEENTKSIEGPSKDPGLPFFPRLLCITWQTVLGVACLLIFVGQAPASFSKWVCPVPPPRAACRTGLSISDPMGSGWHGDCLFATIEDGSPAWNIVVVVCPRWVLRPEAEGGAYNTVGQRARARSTIQSLPRLEGSKRPSHHTLMVLSCRGAGYGPRCRG